MIGLEKRAGMQSEESTIVTGIPQEIRAQVLERVLAAELKNVYNLQILADHRSMGYEISSHYNDPTRFRGEPEFRGNEYQVIPAMKVVPVNLPTYHVDPKVYAWFGEQGFTHSRVSVGEATQYFYGGQKSFTQGGLYFEQGIDAAGPVIVSTRGEGIVRTFASIYCRLYAGEFGGINGHLPAYDEIIDESVAEIMGENLDRRSIKRPLLHVYSYEMRPVERVLYVADARVVLSTHRTHVSIAPEQEQSVCVATWDQILTMHKEIPNS